MKDKRELLRITVVDATAVYDKTGKQNGRGFYLCKDENCIDRAAKNKSLAKQFGFTVDSELSEQLKNEIK